MARESTAEDVAELLGVAAPTFHAHLRKAERGLVSAYLAAVESGDEGSADGTSDP